MKVTGSPVTHSHPPEGSEYVGDAVLWKRPIQGRLGVTFCRMKSSSAWLVIVAKWPGVPCQFDAAAALRAEIQSRLPSTTR